MSFSADQVYNRHILRPLGLPNAPTTTTQHRELRRPTESKVWTSTVHTFLGAINRTSPAAWSSDRFHEDANKIPFDAKFDKHYDPKTALPKISDINDTNFRLYDMKKESDDQNVPQPSLVVKRYISNARKHNVPGLTLLILPGMGVPKEMFEPMIDVILPILSSNNVEIEEIWSLDMPMSGESALVNPPGYLYGNEKDITRDILQFVTAYLPLTATGGKLPQNLPYRAPKPSGHQNARKNVHVIAHSLGAQAAILAAVHAPQLFSSLTVFDPAIVPPGKVLEAFIKLPSEVFCTMIPEFLPSREALRDTVYKNKRTRGWDKRAVEVFVDRGAIDEKGKGGIKLTSPPRLEWALYYDKETPSHTFDRLTDLQIPINAIMPERPFATPRKLFEHVFQSIPSSKKNLVWIPNTTHQIVYERIDECGQNVCEWLKGFAQTNSKAHL